MDAYSVTPNFTDFLNFPFIGRFTQTLSSPNEIAVTRSFARQQLESLTLSGNLSLGRYIVYFDGEKNIYKKIFEPCTITTVIDDSQKEFSPFWDITRITGRRNITSHWILAFYIFIELSSKVTAPNFLTK